MKNRLGHISYNATGHKRKPFPPPIRTMVSSHDGVLILVTAQENKSEDEYLKEYTTLIYFTFSISFVPFTFSSCSLSLLLLLHYLL